jgi:CBS domain containing-hemolysin-like protein
LQSKLEVEMLNFLNWYTRLNSTDKVSVWSKDGQYKGLFNKDNEQMVEGYFDHLRREAKKVMIEKTVLILSDMETTQKTDNEIN